MADQARKWTVTYTKHVKQKRKVYQDGYLLLQSNNKVMLYDDTDKLLAEKFLKGDEKLNFGESLTFASYLVDVGDSENAEVPQEEKSKKSSGPDKSCAPGRQKASVLNISPSRKFIREFKKRENFKCALQERSPISTTSIAGEWQALYTTHLTQKAKKYHDGFIELILCGSQGRQAKLYDESKTYLTSKFLKKDENICSGQSVKFDGYLIDIGDPVNHENVINVKEEGQNCNTSEKPRAVARKRFLHSSSNNDDGVSSLKIRNLPQSYVTAYTLFKKGNSPRDACSGKDVEQKLNSSAVNAAKVGSTERGVPNMSLRGGNPLHDACSVKDVKQKLNSSAINAAKVGSTESDAPNMSLRGAHQILSFLKKPTSPRSTFVTEQAPEKQCYPSPDLVMLDTDYNERFEGSFRQESDQLRRQGTRESEDKVPQHEGLTQPSSETDKGAESRDNPSQMLRKIKIEKDCDDGISVQPRSSSAVVFSSNSIDLESPTLSHQGQDKVAATNTTNITRPVISSAPEIILPLVDLEKPQAQELMPSKGISDSSDNHYHTNTQSGDNHQHRKTNSKAVPRRGEIKHSVNMRSAKTRSSSSKMDDFPSFDLRF